MLKELWQLLKSYLLNCSAHGFARLVEGPDGSKFNFFRVLWGLKIMAAFSFAGFLVGEYLYEVGQSPVAITNGYVRVLVKYAMRFFNASIAFYEFKSCCFSSSFCDTLEIDFFRWRI